MVIRWDQACGKVRAVVAMPCAEALLSEKNALAPPGTCRASAGHVFWHLAVAWDQGCGQGRAMAAVARSGALLLEKNVLANPSGL